MYKEVDYEKLASDNPPWQWLMRGCDGVVILLRFEDEDVLEPEDVEWLEQEG